MGIFVVNMVVAASGIDQLKLNRITVGVNIGNSRCSCLIMQTPIRVLIVQVIPHLRIGTVNINRSIFSIELIIDYLYTADVFKGDPYKYRMNKPGTVAKTNWSLTIPLSLEDLLKHEVCGKIKKLVSASGRLNRDA